MRIKQKILGERVMEAASHCERDLQTRLIELKRRTSTADEVAVVPPVKLSDEHRFLPGDLQYDEARDLIGRGDFDDVYKAVDCRLQNNAIVAVKKLNIGGSRLTDDEMRELTSEAQILVNVPRHDNLVNAIGVCDHPRHYALVLEFVDGENLYNKLRQSDPFMQPWGNRLLLAEQIADGMRHLHSLHSPIIHRDLKPQNVLLHSTKDGYICKITNFGLSKMRMTSRLTTKRSIKRSTDGASSLVYVAPERYLFGEQHGSSKHASTKVDVYSFGVILWQFRERKQPFEDEKDVAVEINVKTGVPFQSPKCWCPHGHDELTNTCVSLEPSKRPSFSDISKTRQQLRKLLAIQD